MRRPIANFAGMALAAVMQGTQPAFPSNAPRVPLPPILRDMGRRTRNRILARAEARAVNRRNQATNRRKIADYFSKKGDVWPDQQRLIGAMTNWQRTKWQRETGNDTEIEVLERYAAMPHWKQKA